MERDSWMLVGRDGERGDFTQRRGRGARLREASVALHQSIKARAAALPGEPAEPRSPWAPTKRRFS